MAERHFIAVEDIPLGGVLAYTRGQTVTAEAVEANGWHDSVAAVGTKAAAEVQAAITGRDPAEFTTTTSAKSSSRSDSATTTEQKG